MLYSHDWLRTLVPHPLSARDVAQLIGRHVATVDNTSPVRADLAPIVVARVVQAGPHPNSDHLWVTKVDDGTGEPVDVVCGAPNVVEGTLYPFARVGTVMPTGNKGGILIEKRKIRGEWSSGMLCSARELGLGDDADGIMPLALDVPTGTPLLTALPNASDTQLEVDVLPNRPDLLSHRGMARELAALTGVAARSPNELIDVETGAVGQRLSTRFATGTQAVIQGVTTRLEDIEGCHRYMGVVIRGVRVGPSPEWLVKRLAAVGVRSHSNVVDATNYMLHGEGQPMHAFDLKTLGGSSIVIRRARAGERLVTLDGTTRALTPDMTVNADAERAIAVAGVMGGKETEVTDATTDVYLEVAHFDAKRVRQTRRALGMSTDASYRYERGIDGNHLPAALTAAARLVVAVAGGSIDEAAADLGAPPAALPAVELSVSRGARLLGNPITRDGVAANLSAIGFGVHGGPDALIVSPPSWRADVQRDADLVEEIARLQGYDTLPDSLSAFRPGNVPDHPQALLATKLRDTLVAEGLMEVKPMPFVKGDDATHVRVANPLAADEPHLRRTISETLARRAEHNLARMEGNVRLFEVGSVFANTSDKLPREALHVGALLMGARRPPHFTEPRPPAFDAWDVRALGERLMAVAYPDGAISCAPGGPDRLWTLEVNGEERGRVFQVTLDRPVWAQEAFGVEIWLGMLENADIAPAGCHAYDATAARPATSHVQYKPLPAYPAAHVDLALVLHASHTAAQVDGCIRAAAGPLLESLVVFDEYRGAGLETGTRSVAWRLTFRDPSRTLRDKEIEGRRAKILQTLEKELGIRTRT